MTKSAVENSIRNSSSNSSFISAENSITTISSRIFILNEWRMEAFGSKGKVNSQETEITRWFPVVSLLTCQTSNIWRRTVSCGNLQRKLLPNWRCNYVFFSDIWCKRYPTNFHFLLLLNILKYNRMKKINMKIGPITWPVEVRHWRMKKSKMTMVMKTDSYNFTENSIGGS